MSTVLGWVADPHTSEVQDAALAIEDPSLPLELPFATTDGKHSNNKSFCENIHTWSPDKLRRTFTDCQFQKIHLSDSSVRNLELISYQHPEQLTIKNFRALSSISGLQTQSLFSLTITDCPEITETALGALSQLPLSTLRIISCNLTNLSFLTPSSCRSKDLSLEPTSTLTRTLIHLDISQNPITGLEQLHQCSRLTTLIMAGFKHHLNRGELSLLPPNLSKLDLSNTSRVQSLEDIYLSQNRKQTCSLRVVNASFCSELQNIQHLQYFSNLRELELGNCTKVFQDGQRIPMECLPNLHSLSLNDTLIRDISTIMCRQQRTSWCCFSSTRPFFTTPPNLKSLFLDRCTNLLNYDLLGTFGNLTHLSLNVCTQIRSLKFLKEMNLETLRIRGINIFNREAVFANQGLTTLEIDQKHVTLAFIQLRKLRVLQTEYQRYEEQGVQELLGEISNSCRAQKVFESIIEESALGGERERRNSPSFFITTERNSSPTPRTTSKTITPSPRTTISYTYTDTSERTSCNDTPSSSNRELSLKSSRKGDSGSKRSIFLS